MLEITPMPRAASTAAELDAFAAFAASDMPEVAAALQQVYATESLLLAARMDDRLVGCAAMTVQSAETSAEEAVLSVVYVQPAFRRRGLGRLLVGALANAASQRGLYTLHCVCGDAPEGQAFFAALGAKRTALPQEYLLSLEQTDGLRQKCRGGKQP